MGADIDHRTRNMPLSSPFFTAMRRIASDEVDQLGLTSWRRIALVALLPAYGASYLVWYYAGWGGAEVHQLMVPIAFVPILLFSIAVAFRASRVGSSAATRRAWACIGLAMTAYAGGNLAWLSFGMTGQPIPFPSIADVGFLAFFPIVLVGLGLLPRE